MNLRKILLKYFLLLFAIYYNLIRVTAQDNHYWSQQYGAESTLMGGAMTGGVSDNSAVYYNPGAITFITNPSLSIDANVYRIDKILIKDGGGNGINLNSAQISIYPQIISGMLKLSKSNKLKFSYALLTRNHNNVLMNARYTNKASDSNPDDPSSSANSFVGAYDYVNQMDEQWLGFGTGYSLSDKLGIGATLFGSYRGQSYQQTNYVREVNYKNQGSTYITKNNDEAVKYYNIRLLAKFGLSYVTGNWRTGFTITTPSLSIYGNGSAQREVSYIAVSEDPDDMEKNFIIMDRNSNVKVGYKHPLSISIGIEYHTSKTSLAFTAEYFSPVDNYYLMKPTADPFVYPPGLLDSANLKPVIDGFLLVENSAKSVINFAVGLNQVIYKQFNLLAGISTDFSSYDHSSTTNEFSSSKGVWDIYHLSTGLSYHKQKNTITFGLSYAFTPSQNIPPYAIINQSPEITDTALLSSRSYSVILGYTYYFARYE